MTNQSELYEQVSAAMYDTDYKHVIEDPEYFDRAAVDAVVEFITANYTPNSEVEQLKASIAQTIKRVSDILIPPGSTFTESESRFIIKKFRTLLERGMEDE